MLGYKEYSKVYQPFFSIGDFIEYLGVWNSFCAPRSVSNTVAHSQSGLLLYESQSSMQIIEVRPGQHKIIKRDWLGCRLKGRVIKINSFVSRSNKNSCMKACLVMIR
jgi:hypothetical protein